MNLMHLRRYGFGFIAIGISILPFSANTLPQGWRGIVPIRSTCQDVERVLGENACGKKSVKYELADETVDFGFSENGCDGKWPTQPYNVPTGTVIGITVMPRPSKHLTLSDLNVELAKFQKTDVSDMVGVFKYLSQEVGMYITASEDGQVLDYHYVPAAKYDNLRCPPSAASPTPTRVKNKNRHSSRPRASDYRL